MSITEGHAERLNQQTKNKQSGARRKYHSGTICAGVTKEFANIKLSE